MRIMMITMATNGMISYRESSQTHFCLGPKPFSLSIDLAMGQDKC
jgi:hypothetical protein